MPTSEEIADNEILVLVESESDRQGRCRFVAFWRDQTGVKLNGVAGQMFHADLDEFTAQNDRQNLKTRHWIPASENAAFATDRLGDK